MLEILSFLNKLKSILQITIIIALWLYNSPIALSQSPDYPKLIFPESNTTILGPTVNFIWSEFSSNSIESYDIIISTDSNFSTHIDSATIYGNNYVNNSLVLNQKLFWRVKEANSNWSSTSSFTIINPTTNDSLGLWLKADDLNLNNNDPVSLWNDIGLFGNDAEQSVTSKQPTFTTDQLNALPSLSFDGDDFLSTGNTLGIYESHSFYIVCKLNNGGALRTMFAKSVNSNGGIYIGTNNSDRLNIFIDTQQKLSPNSIGNEFVLINGILKPSPDSSHIYLNGSKVISFVTSQDLIGSNAADFTIGGAGSSFSWNGEIAELVIIKDSLSDPSNILFQNYLMDKYAPPINLGKNIVTCDTNYTIEAYNNSYQSYIWNTLETDSTITVDTTGLYFISTTDIFGRTSSDSIHIEFDTSQHSPSLADTLRVCIGNSLPVYAGPPHLSYTWNTGETSNIKLMDSTALYWVDISDCSGMTQRDSIYIEVINNEFNLGLDQPLCLYDSLILSSGLSNNLTYNWSTGDTTSSITVFDPNIYSLEVSDKYNCSYSDSITITSIDSFPQEVSLGIDRTVCKGSNLGLASGHSPGLSYLWSSTDTSNQIVIDSSGTYFVETINDNNCIGRDTIIIDTNGIAPNVNFTSQNLCTNSLVIFTNHSSTSDGSNIISEQWFFGDGDSTTTQNPNHQYTLDQSYTVTLEILTDSGCTNTFDTTIQINLPPTSGLFVSSNPICSGNTTYFSDNSFSTDTIDSWSWNFGDTSSTDTSSLQHPNYEYSTTNIYNVQLITTTQHGCADTITVPITVKQSPIVSFNSTNHCQGVTTQFSSTTQGNIFALNWDFGDFQTSTINSPTNIYGSSGSYLVTLAATEVNGCADTTSSLITIYENPMAKFYAPNFCADSPSQLFDSSSTNSGTITDWNWNVSNHSNQSNDQNPSFTFSTADTGLYYVDLVILSDLGCTDSIRDSINVYPLPSPNFTFDPLTGAPPLIINFTNTSNGNNTYFWTFGDDSTSTEISPSHLYQDSSLYDVNLIATSTYGCIDSTSNSIYIIDPVTDISVNSVTYSFSSNSDYLNISTNLSNLGTFPITNTDLEIEISGMGTTLEKWEGSITPGSSLDYNISSSYKVNGDLPDLICIRAPNPNNLSDDKPSNNEFCITVNKFQLISISPIPTASNLDIVYILPTDGEVQIDLYDASGKKIDNLFSNNLEKGLIRQSFNLSIYGNGIHIIAIKFQGNSIKEKIIIK